MATTKYHGKGGMIILEGVGKIPGLHGWSFHAARDIADTPEQCEEWKDSIRGQGAWGGAFSDYYDGSNVGDFYDIVNSTSAKDIYLYPRGCSGDMTKYFYGDTWCDFDLNVPVDGHIDITGTLTGTGQLFKSPGL